MSLSTQVALRSLEQEKQKQQEPKTGPTGPNSQRDCPWRTGGYVDQEVAGRGGGGPSG